MYIYIYIKEEWVTRDKNTDEMGESDRKQIERREQGKNVRIIE